MKPLTLTLLLFLLVPSAPALADTLLLEGGGSVEGVVTETKDGYRVESLSGTAIVKRSRVIGRVKGPYITQIHDQKLARIDRFDPDELTDLAIWCEKNGLERRARRHLEEALVLDPDHARARRKLGYVLHRGVWMTPEEARRAKMVELGFVEVDGRWFTEAGLKAYLAAKKEQAELAVLAEKRKREREAAERKAREEEERLKLLAAERKLVEQAVARAREEQELIKELRRENAELRALVASLIRELEYLSGTGAGCYLGIPPYGR